METKNVPERQNSYKEHNTVIPTSFFCNFIELAFIRLISMQMVPKLFTITVSIVRKFISLLKSLNKKKGLMTLRKGFFFIKTDLF